MPMGAPIKLSIQKNSFTDRLRFILQDIGEFFRDIRNKVVWGWQRLFRGYDDTCEWALDDYLNPIVLHHLRYSRKMIDDDKRLVSIPGCFCEKNDFDTAVAEWKTVLDIMIEGFELMILGTDDIEIVDNIFWRKIMEDRQDKIDRALELFGKHYQSLWT